VSLATQLERELQLLGTPARASGSKAYLKSQLAFFGVTVPALRKTVRAAERAAPLASRAALFATVDALWNRGVFELKLAAVELLSGRDDLVTAASLPRLRGLIASSQTWALVDPLSTGVVAGVYEREPAIAKTLDAWARHDDFWIRRAALLAHLPQLRRGAGDFARFARFADAMLDEREFFIRKAIGWVLRETSKRRPELVADWLAPRIARVSGVTLREAVKYLPAARKKLLVAGSRARASPRSASAR
jgi:3-methyladenine DNA glycosylase AlkD